MPESTIDEKLTRPDPEVRPKRRILTLAGRKAVDPLIVENEELRAKIEKLEAQVEVSEEINETQGKVFALLQQLSRKSASPK